MNNTVVLSGSVLEGYQEYTILGEPVEERNQIVR